ncbi:hypothetical protein WA158_000806 [Blastocystis sp. Blastoise]
MFSRLLTFKSLHLYQSTNFFSLSLFQRFCSNETKYILGIETSCDDTCAALLDDKGNIIEHVESSQWNIYEKYQGIIPHLSSRMHLVNLPVVVNYVLQKSGIENIEHKLEGIAVTVGPGLDPCLKMGLDMSKKLCKQYKIPMIPVHHMEGHALVSSIPKEIKEDSFCLLLSGGHSQLYTLTYKEEENMITNWSEIQNNILFNYDNFRGPFHYELLGDTIDDSMGECFDKIARSLAGITPSSIPFFDPHKEYNYQPITFHDIEHPSSTIPVGGADIEKWANEYIDLYSQNNPPSYPPPIFKVPMRQRKDLLFSFSGLKTAVIRYLMKTKFPLSNEQRDHVAFQFQSVAIQHIIDRLKYAHVLYPNIHQIILGGGVTCNKTLRNSISQFCNKNDMKLIAPSLDLCRDNAVMIAWTGLYKYKRNRYIDYSCVDHVDFDSNLELY